MRCTAPAQKTFEAIDLLRKTDPAKHQPENGAQYPTSRLGQSLQQIGQLLKANIGVEVLFIDCGGWDNHVNEGRRAGPALEFAEGPRPGPCGVFIRTWVTAWENIVFVTMSEFGRNRQGKRKSRHRSRAMPIACL